MNKVGTAKKLVLGMCLTAGITCTAARADDCVRSTPAPIFPAGRNDVQAHTFALKSDHEAVEQFVLRSNLQVKVEHGGCEYFVTKIRFESSELFAAKYSDSMAYESAAGLLQELKKARPELNFDLDLASNTLRTEVKRNRASKLNHELSIQGDGVPPLQAMILLDAAGREKSIGFLQVTLFRGPL